MERGAEQEGDDPELRDVQELEPGPFHFGDGMSTWWPKRLLVGRKKICARGPLDGLQGSIGDAGAGGKAAGWLAASCMS